MIAKTLAGCATSLLLAATLSAQVDRPQLDLSGPNLQASSSGRAVAYSSTSWSDGFTSPAEFETFGSGCQGSAGVPLMEPIPDSLPWIGTEFTLEISNLPILMRSVVFGFLGDTDSMFHGAVLPLDLSIIGMTGCSLLINARRTFFLLSEDGVAYWTLKVPNDPGFVGGNFTTQAFAFDAKANGFGISVSNAGLGLVGSQ